MELVFHLYFHFYIYFILKSFFYMWGCGKDTGDVRIPPLPGRVKDGGVMRAGRQFGAGGCIARS